MLLAIQPAFAEKRVALVIGNAAYQNARLPRLANSVNDAEDIAQALMGFDFKVILRKNLDKAGMDKAIAEFGRAAGDADAALFYYAGHGVQIKSRNYLMPIDAKAES